ncbi:hypothetical protein HAT86_06970 [Roseovarius gahaiensis]|uniref:Uncharacterized protein n=1 Tax=Roseovarius gahaiensis TaxID=2716691 RepID=A0A967EFU7_9RHOB|nr:hypothetical protein [Roseovarius gahaiensis]NHQ74206.1 hypothetical protein [Roseovarius gahaiensis]
MADLEQQLAQLKADILEDDSGARYTHAPLLAKLMAELEQQGQRIPPDIRCLHEELVNETIEAQFDNMPV